MSSPSRFLFFPPRSRRFFPLLFGNVKQEKLGLSRSPPLSSTNTQRLQRSAGKGRTGGAFSFHPLRTSPPPFLPIDLFQAQSPSWSACWLSHTFTNGIPFFLTSLFFLNLPSFLKRQVFFAFFSFRYPRVFPFGIKRRDE